MATIALASDLLEARVASSEQRLTVMRDGIARRVRNLNDCPDLCIYTTGSFGRREAGKHSDIDLFFVLDDHEGGKKSEVPYLKKAQIDADLIRFFEELRYPPFSKDGKYLMAHTITNLSKKIGDQHEDSENLFTARMLLFLESTPLHNEAVYRKAIQACVTQYCRDHADHTDNFRPLFLVNDIVRYWRTLCLNYESARTEALTADKPKHKLRNLKLKHSRMMTCYSMLACLCDREEGDSPAKLSRLVGMTPAQRLRHIADKHNSSDQTFTTELYASMIREYEWFLRETDRPEPEALDWIVRNKTEVTDRSANFGDLMFQMLVKVAEATRADLRYLVV